MNNPNQEAITLADLEGLPEQILARGKELGIEDGNPEALASLVGAIVECADDLSIFNGASDPDGNPESFTFYESEDFEILAKRLLSKIVASAGFKQFAQTKKLSDRIRDRAEILGADLTTPTEDEKKAALLKALVGEIEDVFQEIQEALLTTNNMGEFNIEAAAIVDHLATVTGDREGNSVAATTGDILIEAIQYEACFNLGSYENEKIRLSARFTPGQDLGEAIEQLRQLAIQNAKADSDRLWRQREELEIEIERLTQKAQEARQKWEATATFLKAQGIADLQNFPFQDNLLPPAKPDEERVVVGEIDEGKDIPF